MKRLLSVCLLLVLLLSQSPAVSATQGLPPDVSRLGRGVWLISPHGVSPDDPTRLQALIDLAAPGDTIHMAAGVFDFSDFESVRIAKDLTIEGVWNAADQRPLTIVRHGFMPFLIGRKTAVEKPLIEMVDGHPVPYITRDLWGKLGHPYAYPGESQYNIYDDWNPARVLIRKIAFERPYGAAIFIGAMNGGAIDRVRIDDLWPMTSCYNFCDGNSGGILWYGMGYNALVYLERGGSFPSPLYTGTDLIQGNILIQNTTLEGYRTVTYAETLDENGLPLAVARAASPEPPNDDYQGYALQDVDFAFDAYGNGIPEFTQQYWVKRGFGAYADLENPENPNQVMVEKGMWLGLVVLYTQANLVVRHNLIENVDIGMILLDNGFQGRAMNLWVGDNQITPPADGGWVCSFCELSWDHVDPITGETRYAVPGDNLMLTNNTFTSANPDRAFLSSAVFLGMRGNSVATGNLVNLVSGTAFYVSWPTTKSNLARNTVSGSGDYGFLLDWGANDNRVLANDMSAFTPTGWGNWFISASPAHVLLLSDDNLVVGGRGASAWVALDYGANNTVIGMDHQIGVFSEARMLRSTTNTSGAFSPFNRMAGRPAR